MTHSAGGGGSFSRWLNVKSCFFCIELEALACGRTLTHTHTYSLVGWFAHKPATSPPHPTVNVSVHLSICVSFFFCPLPPPLLSFVASVSPVYFCPSVKSSHYVSLPPRRRETTTASVGNYRSTALLRTRPGLSTRQTAMCL